MKSTERKSTLRNIFSSMGVIQRQSIKNFFTSYIGVLIGFVNVLIVQPRFLAPEELGLARVLYSFSILLSTVVPMGSANIAIKFFPMFRNPEKKHHGFFGFLILSTLTGFFFTSILLLISKEFFIAQYVAKSKLFADYFNWVFLLTFLLALVTQLNIYCYSLYKSTVPAFINDIIIRLGIILLVTLYFLKLFSLPVFIGLFVSVYGFQVLLLLLYIFYEERPGLKIDFEMFRQVGWKPILTFGLIIWLASVASMGLKELATVLLGRYVPLEYVAFYVVAAFIPTLIEIPLNALDKIATFNITTALANRQMNIVSEIYRKSSRYLLLIGGYLFLLININITGLLQFLPENYRGGEQVVFILSIGTLFNMATGLNSQILVYSGKYVYGSIMLIAAVLLNFMLQLLLIPEYGLAGAAVATALSGMVLNFINSLLVYRFLRMHPLDSSTLTTVAMVALLMLADSFIPHLAQPVTDIVLHSGIITAFFILWVVKMNLFPELTAFFRNRGND